MKFKGKVNNIPQKCRDPEFGPFFLILSTVSILDYKLNRRGWHLGFGGVKSYLVAEVER